jgi:flagellar protein FliO/FliZ
MRVIGGVALGTRERLVLVEVGETWLVIGVAPGQVSAVHAMPRPDGIAIPEAQAQPGFQDWLMKAMQGRREKS